MKSVVVHAVLALVGLVSAYLTWTREEEPEANLGEVTVADCELGKLESVTIETPRYVNTVLPRGEAGGEGPDAFWISHQRKPKEEKRPEPAGDAGLSQDAGVGDGGTPSGQASAEVSAQASSHSKPPMLPEPEVFAPNEKFAKYLKDIARLRAHRSIGKLEAEREAEFGFDEVDTFFSLTCGGAEFAFEVGGRTYGTGKRYVRRKDTGEVYLLAGSLVQDLQSARYKFRQTSLHRFAFEDVETAEVRALEKQRKLVRKKFGGAGAAQWVDEAEPDKRNELFGNWFARVEKLRVSSYLGEGKEPGSDLDSDEGVVEGAESIVEVAYQTKAGERGRLELVRVLQDKKTHYYARSEATVKWVKLYYSAAKPVAEDVALVVGAEQPDRPEEPAGSSSEQSGPHGSGPAAPGGVPPHGGPS
ncbi:MAG: DUF4340 domain-containing protein, partial [Myxococcales bacterium]|nr:DUF4340 domain-containing protein [Myxococcales bacterium]